MYGTMNIKCIVTSTLKVIQNREVCHITVVDQLQLNHDDVTNRLTMDNL
jgi:hypothetical protein